MAEPPPAPPQIGATKDPMARFLLWTLSASFFRSSSLESMSTCGDQSEMSSPSNFTPSTSAAAVSSSISSNPMKGSAPGDPFPTTPGHVALCSLG